MDVLSQLIMKKEIYLKRKKNYVYSENDQLHQFKVKLLQKRVKMYTQKVSNKHNKYTEEICKKTVKESLAPLSQLNLQTIWDA